MADFIVTAPLAESYRQALEQAYHNAESGRPFALPEEMAQSRDKHFQYLEQLKAGGKLLCAGPLVDFSAAILIFVDTSREELERIMAKQPHIRTGYITGWEAREWQRKV